MAQTNLETPRDALCRLSELAGDVDGAAYVLDRLQKSMDHLGGFEDSSLFNALTMVIKSLDRIGRELNGIHDYFAQASDKHGTSKSKSDEED